MKIDSESDKVIVCFWRSSGKTEFWNLVKLSPMSENLLNNSIKQAIEEMWLYDSVLVKYRLASAFYEGWGVEKNEKLAIEEFEKLAKEGHIPSGYRYARMLQYGEWSKRQAQDAFEQYKNLAQRGDIPSQHELARMYPTYGHDEWFKHLRAAYWYNSAAKQGYIRSVQELSEMCTYGGYKQNLVLAYYCL